MFLSFLKYFLILHYFLIHQRLNFFSILNLCYYYLYLNRQLIKVYIIHYHNQDLNYYSLI